MKRFSLKYSIFTSKMDLLWFPVAFFGVFVIIASIEKNAPQFMSIVRAYLGAASPLVGGVLAAYALLEDPAIELRFATPIKAAQTLFEKLGLIFVIQAVLALIFQLIILSLGGNFSMYSSGWHLQLAWILPTLTLMLLGCVCSLLAANSTIGALIVGMVWLVQLIARSWFAGNFGKYFLVFMGAFMGDHPDLTANHVSLLIVCVVFFVLSLALLKRQERYI